MVLAALGFGGYQLFKPKPPVPVARSENGPSGSLVPTDTASHAQPHTGAGANPLSSSTSSPASVSPASNPASDITLPNEKKAPSEALQNAQTALSGGRLFRPRNSSAYYWAKQAEQAGDPQGARLEETIYSTAKRQVQRYTDAKNFTAATALVTQMREAYPDRNDLAQLSASVQSAQAVQAGPPQQAQNRPQEQPPVQPVAQQVPTPAQNTQPAPQPVQPPVQQQPPQEAQQAAPSQGYPGVQRPQAGGGAIFVVEHRHVGFNSFSNRFNNSFCTGTLAILPNGTVRYDCVRTQDLRCDHVTFAAADIKQVKMVHGGGVHIATRTMGNWDFFGQAQQISGAFQALTQLMSNR